MPWKRLLVAGAVMVALAMFAGGCAAQRPQTAAIPAESQPTKSAASSETTAAMRQAVAADAGQIMADVDASSVKTSSNPFDYVDVSPRFNVLVARGMPAVPAIADEIEASKEDGLREYLLAIAATRIQGASGAATALVDRQGMGCAIPVAVTDHYPEVV